MAHTNVMAYAQRHRRTGVLTHHSAHLRCAHPLGL